MVAIGNQLYIATVEQVSDATAGPSYRSVVHKAVSANPTFTEMYPEILAQGPGRITHIDIYHSTRSQHGRAASITSRSVVVSQYYTGTSSFIICTSGSRDRPRNGCHMLIGRECVCMEGYAEVPTDSCLKGEQHRQQSNNDIDANVSLSPLTNDLWFLLISVDINERKLPFILNTLDGQLIVGRFVENVSSSFCSPEDVHSVLPITPIQNSQSVIRQIDYDYKKSVIY